MEEYLGHRHDEELVHFDFDVATRASDFSLVGPGGKTELSQIEDLVRTPDGRVRGRIWTVVSLAPRARLRLQLRTKAATPSIASIASTEVGEGVRVVAEDGELRMENDRVAIALPRWSTKPSSDTTLSDLRGPFRAVRRAGGGWIGASRWVPAGSGAALRIAGARTEVIEQGPVRATVRQSFSLADGRSYAVTFSLAAKQDAVVVVEHGNVDAPTTALRVSVSPGLGADRVYWHNQWAGAPNESWQLMESPLTFDRERVILRLRPWSFWWLPHVSEWAGFYQEGGQDLFGVIMLRPERWAPYHWGGFDRTEVAVTERAAREVDLTFPLVSGLAQPSTPPQPSVLHREWAITVGAREAHVTKEASRSRLRSLLLQHGEFPLDELKSYGFEWAERGDDAPRAVVFDAATVQRVRDQAKRDPTVAERVQKAINYIGGCGGLGDTLAEKGASAFYERYVVHQLMESLPQAYLGSSEPIYGAFMAAAVKGLAAEVVQTFLSTPTKPALGAYGPWFSETVTRLLLNYELIRDTGDLTRSEEVRVKRALVFGAQVLSHPAYWNPDRGLASGNPNMSASIMDARGVLGLALRGHPASALWTSHAQAQLQRQLANWISPGGAWIENPFYQLRSLDMMFLLARMTQRAGGSDYFAEPRFRETLTYLGFLLTPPDPRFRSTSGDALMTLPTVGHSFVGTISPFHGWAAAEAKRSDPIFSAQQQFFWNGQGRTLENAERLKGVAAALTEPALDAAPPRETSRAFEGFGTVMRSSWTDQKASYLLHRTGPHFQHYDADHGAVLYYAKGAPLCPDWGNLYQPVARSEASYHNLVTFHGTDSNEALSFAGDLATFRSLANVVDYSHGRTWAGEGDQRSSRHALLVKSDDALGANYAVLRDVTTSSMPESAFVWNLWCLSKKPSCAKNIVHFPGQFGVDLDAHILSPSEPQVEYDQWSWQQQVPVWGAYREQQYGLKVRKLGSTEDFFVVLEPRVTGQRRARVVKLAGGRGVRIEHAEGTDYLLMSPGASNAVVKDGLVRLSGEVAFARRYRSGTVRLALVRGSSEASLDGFSLHGEDAVAVEVSANRVVGHSSGSAQRVRLDLSKARSVRRLTIDREEVPFTGPSTVDLSLPAGEHEFELELRQERAVR